MASAENEFGTKCSAEISKKLYLNVDTADVYFSFEIDGEEHSVPAHKNILSLGSPVFYAMFYGKMKETGTIKIVDASKDAFKDFLTIFYHDKVMFTNENVAELINLCNKYDVPEGLQICEQFLTRKTGVSDLCIDFSLAIKFNFNNLHKHCENRIRENAATVLKTDAFINSSKELLKLILEVDHLTCFEDDIFNACIAWAENIAGTSDRKVLRDALAECFYLIPFTTMPIDVFTSIMSANQALFTLDEVAAIIRRILTGKETQVSQKFCKTCKVVNIFDWNEGRLIKCTRDRFDEENVSECTISHHEYTSFSASKKVLLGGFRFLPFKNETSSGETLSATILVTKQHGAVCELLECNINFEVISNQMTSELLEIKLAKPIVVIPNMMYSIDVNFSINELNDQEMVDDWVYEGGRFSSELSSVIVDNDICISFHNHPNFPFGSEYSVITEFYFNRL